MNCSHFFAVDQPVALAAMRKTPPWWKYSMYIGCSTFCWQEVKLIISLLLLKSEIGFFYLWTCDAHVIRRTAHWKIKLNSIIFYPPCLYNLWIYPHLFRAIPPLPHPEALTQPFSPLPLHPVTAHHRSPTTSLLCQGPVSHPAESPVVWCNHK